ncbi:MAG: 3-deoxy-D-manno-octulosonate 8-phosphate phosphatase [Osedax symbiont Rs2]|nr:MAG: 3-deoxy-D-manno-octulosonate 8-phosphate phosphatase [Osedax symbiont Rs2]
MKRISNPALSKRARQIKLAVFDVDGIMTDGSLYLLADGSEIKTFNTLDGLGLKLLQNNGIQTAIITGRSSPQVERRAASLGVNYLLQNRDDKLQALKEICSDSGHTLQQCAYIGDDLPDLAAIRAVAFGATVPNAHPLLIEQAHWCTSRSGGKGAAREFCEAILDAQSLLDNIYNEYL